MRSNTLEKNYMDVVALIQGVKLNGEFLCSKYTLIMKTLYQIGFIVILIIFFNINNCFQRQEHFSIPLNSLGVKSSLHPNSAHI
uniref:Uncharacterized protein n=1 Tax=Lepeophtheirus salmonis TaxID=72036 RepID=A0A0K2VK31_LEPSM